MRFISLRIGIMASISIPAAQVPTDEELLAHVDSFLDRAKPHGMTPTRFGIEVMREGGLVASLRGGRSLSLKNVKKVLEYIQHWRPDNGGAAGASSTNGGEIIRTDAEADTPRPFATTSPTCSETNAPPSPPQGSPASSTDGEAEAA